jgi:hypothetical protein
MRMTMGIAREDRVRWKIDEVLGVSSVEGIVTVTPTTSDSQSFHLQVVNSFRRNTLK